MVEPAATPVGPPHGPGVRVRRPRPSGLAIASLVLALLACIPGASIPALGVGVIALLVLRNDPTRWGRGIAAAAVVISIVVTAGWIWLTATVWGGLFGGPADVLARGLDGDAAGFRAGVLMAGDRSTDADAAAFLAAVADRYGSLESVRVDRERSADGLPFEPDGVRVPYLYEFSSGPRAGWARFHIGDPDGGGLAARFSSITIEDREQGDLTFPPPPAEPDPDGEPEAGEAAGSTEPAP